MRRTFTSGIAVLGLSLASQIGAFGTPGQAMAESPEREAAEICRFADEQGTLKDMGRTRADCFGALMGPSDAEAGADVLALCSVEKIREKVGVAETNRCVQRMRELVVVQG
jgi:hypothetical protein